MCEFVIIRHSLTSVNFQVSRPAFSFDTAILTETADIDRTVPERMPERNSIAC